MSNVCKFLQPIPIDGESYPMSHVKAVWKTVKVAAIQETQLQGHCYVEHDSDHVTLVDCNQKTHKIFFQEFKAAMLSNHEQMESLIGEFLGAQLRPMYDRFKVTKFCQDNVLDPRSIFSQPRNRLYLEEFQEQLLDSIKGLGQEELVLRAEMLIRLSEKMIFALSACCGVAPKSHVFGNLQYDSYPGSTSHNRNVFLIDDLICIGTQATTTWGCKTKGELWATYPALGKALAFYLGVIRPAEIYMASMRSLQAPYHDTHIFVLIDPAKSQQPYLYTSHHVNQALVRCWKDFPVKLNNKLLIKLTRCIVDIHWPGLFRDPNKGPTTLVNKAAQHTNQVGGTSYGVLSGLVPNSRNMSIERADISIILSQMYQAFFGLSSVPEGWGDRMNSVASYACRRNEVRAIKTAGNLVCSLYKLGGRDQSHTRDRANKLLGMSYLEGRVRCVFPSYERAQEILTCVLCHID